MGRELSLLSKSLNGLFRCKKIDSKEKREDKKDAAEFLNEIKVSLFAETDKEGKEDQPTVITKHLIGRCDG